MSPALRRELAALPARFGFSSLDEFEKAVYAAAAATGQPIGATSDPRPARRRRRRSLGRSA